MMKYNNSILLNLVIVFFIIGFICPLFGLNTENLVYVGPNSSKICISASQGCGSLTNPFSSIREAIGYLMSTKNSTVDHSILNVLVLNSGIYKGTQHKSFNLDGLNGLSKLEIRSTTLDPSNTIIDCDGIGYGFIVSNFNYFSLKGVTIKGCNYTTGSTIKSTNSSISLTSVSMLNNDASVNFGGSSALDLQGSTLMCWGCIFQDNSTRHYIKLTSSAATFVQESFTSRIVAPNSILANNGSLLSLSNSLVQYSIDSSSTAFISNDISQVNNPTYITSNPTDTQIVCASDATCTFSGSLLSITTSGVVQSAQVLNTPTFNGIQLSTTNQLVMEGFFKVPQDGVYNIEFDGTSLGVQVYINNLLTINSNFQQDNIQSVLPLTLFSQSVNYFKVVMSTTVSSSKTGSLFITRKGAPTNQISTFYSQNVCNDGIYDLLEQSSSSAYFCPADSHGVQKGVIVCGDNLCNEAPNSCITDCYKVLGSQCPAQISPIRLSSYYHMGDTFGALMNNQYINSVPGLIHMSHGVDFLSGNELTSPIFDFGYCNTDYTIFENFNLGYLFAIPSDYNVDYTPSCSYDAVSNNFETSQDIANSISTSNSKGLDFKSEGNVPDVGSGGLGLSYTNDETVTTSTEISSGMSGSIQVTSVQCNSYQVSRNPQFTKFSYQFLQDLASMTDTTDAQNVILKYGTYYYVQAGFGGQLTMVTATEESWDDSNSEQDTNECSKISFNLGISIPDLFSVGFSYTHSVDTDISTSQYASYQTQSTNSSVLYKGGAPGSFGPTCEEDIPCSFGDWAQTVDSNPVPINFTLDYIGNVIPSSWVTTSGANVQNLWFQALGTYINSLLASQATQTTAKLNNKIRVPQYRFSMYFDKPQNYTPPSLHAGQPILSIAYQDGSKEILQVVKRLPHLLNANSMDIYITRYYDNVNKTITSINVTLPIYLNATLSVLSDKETNKALYSTKSNTSTSMAFIPINSTSKTELTIVIPVTYSCNPDGATPLTANFIIYVQGDKGMHTFYYNSTQLQNNCQLNRIVLKEPKVDIGEIISSQITLSYDSPTLLPKVTSFDFYQRSMLVMQASSVNSSKLLKYHSKVNKRNSFPFIKNGVLTTTYRFHYKNESPLLKLSFYFDPFMEGYSRNSSQILSANKFVANVSYADNTSIKISLSDTTNSIPIRRNIPFNLMIDSNDPTLFVYLNRRALQISTSQTIQIGVGNNGTIAPIQLVNTIGNMFWMPPTMYNVSQLSFFGFSGPIKSIRKLNSKVNVWVSYGNLTAQVGVMDDTSVLPYTIWRIDVVPLYNVFYESITDPIPYYGVNYIFTNPFSTKTIILTGTTPNIRFICNALLDNIQLMSCNTSFNVKNQLVYLNINGILSYRSYNLYFQGITYKDAVSTIKFNFGTQLLYPNKMLLTFNGTDGVQHNNTLYASGSSVYFDRDGVHLLTIDIGQTVAAGSYLYMSSTNGFSYVTAQNQVYYLPTGQNNYNVLKYNNVQIFPEGIVMADSNGTAVSSYLFRVPTTVQPTVSTFMANPGKYLDARYPTKNSIDMYKTPQISNYLTNGKTYFVLHSSGSLRLQLSPSLDSGYVWSMSLTSTQTLSNRRLMVGNDSSICVKGTNSIGRLVKDWCLDTTGLGGRILMVTPQLLQPKYYGIQLYSELGKMVWGYTVRNAAVKSAIPYMDAISGMYLKVGQKLSVNQFLTNGDGDYLVLGSDGNLKFTSGNPTNPSSSILWRTKIPYGNIKAPFILTVDSNGINLRQGPQKQVYWSLLPITNTSVSFMTMYVDKTQSGFLMVGSDGTVCGGVVLSSNAKTSLQLTVTQSSVNVFTDPISPGTKALDFTYNSAVNAYEFNFVVDYYNMKSNQRYTATVNHGSNQLTFNETFNTVLTYKICSTAGCDTITPYPNLVASSLYLLDEIPVLVYLDDSNRIISMISSNYTISIQI